MADLLYSGTKTAEMFIAGLGGGFAYNVASNGAGLIDLSLIAGVFFAFTVLVFGLHIWYERKRDEPFR